MEGSVDVVIVGGAATGSALAYFLSNSSSFKGSILVLEKDASYQKCATALSVASIRHQFSTRENIQLSQFGTEFIRNIGDTLAVDGDRPDVNFHEAGYLFLATQAGYDVMRENHALQCSLGAQIVLMNATELQRKYPWMNVSDLAAGSWGEKGEGWLDAYGMMRAFRRKAISQGVRYLENEVVQIHKAGANITGVTLDNGDTIACGVLVNAAGTGAMKLAQQAGITLPIESRKRSVFYFTCPEKINHCPMVIDASGVYFHPEGEGFITGVQPPEDQDPECFDFDVQYQLFDDIIWPTLAHRVPAFEAIRCEHSWAGHYDYCTFDQNVILGYHPDIKNMVFANGFSGHGMQQSPAVGRGLAELIEFGEYKSLNLKRLGWERVLSGQPIIEKNVW
ncbi:MAG: FAD-binding oxidoreductase [Alcaligenaceae bacterium]|nr:FAD-binding oxidoreductase [Alcaligenaceae bacterium]